MEPMCIGNASVRVVCSSQLPIVGYNVGVEHNGNGVAINMQLLR